MSDLKVVEAPIQHVGDIARGLRRMADQIEAGEFGAAHVLAWVIDTGGAVEVGMLGQSGEPGAVGHLLLALGQRKLERSLE